ncbi:peptide-methionine (S)-S-oxide reductase MsrA [Sphingobacterium alkalisoli]|uniref:Peptide methionine sulfoxide reductase MsrA n=1 Tax=Sphingobacterium alkalisoli TaxID=1874115 RepID=A0A4U0GWD1_9SPHI|nr:peptide-methionine (S)-S-oxide reductase MsrA [Sphingobacterium alkalisoli]TJY63383.1 peptide-methionine (S)-S-oxide reductase MsrA [Sphingobacterium alkalisoli]GGH25713.1 peptide methionine sulfoxide reductase MsrA [Sphingobacterium alkalisoli]
MKKIGLLLLLLLPVLGSCQHMNSKTAEIKQIRNMGNASNTAILAAGCFWCVEAPLLLLDGVDTVVSGYIGGHVVNPNYTQVSMGNTGHAEAVLIKFDPSKISYDGLLEAFFLIHDPTQLNRQGNDIGTQYRSAIFPLNDEQEEKARYYIEKLNAEKVYDNPIVTTIENASEFYKAEDYHQNYYALNPNEMYCRLVIKPKMDKFKKVFADKLK